MALVTYKALCIDAVDAAVLGEFWAKALSYELELLADGDAVTVAPIRSEVTTQQAADLLNVSRPHLIKLLDQGAFPFHRVGNRRKMALSDVLHLRDRLIETRREKVDHHLGDSETLGVVEDDELELRQ